jgi:hypothetical protein
MRRLWRQAGRSLRRAVVGRLYQDRFPDPGRSVLIAGMARSGTTWLADVVSSQGPNRILVEPFNPYPVGPFKSPAYIPYRRPADSDTALHAFCAQLFSGQIRHPWIDQQGERLAPRYRVVKAVRANLMLKWLRLNFPQVKAVLLFRHPAAVVASWLRLGWSGEQDWNAFVSQAALRQDFLAPKWPVMEQCQTAEERIAAIWCINHLVPLRQLQSGDAPVVFYERLVAEPQTEIPHLFGALGRPYDDSVFDALAELSATSRRGLASARPASELGRWRQSLSAEQLRRVGAVVQAFGLGDLYGDADMPIGYPIEWQHYSLAGSPAGYLS